MNLGLMKRRRGVGKSLSTKDYVQDGLVAMWDGIENIGIGKHSNTATEWVDLTGNGRDMQLINDAYFNANSIVAEGHPVAEYTNSIPLEQHITQEIVFKVDSDVRDNTSSRTVIAFFGSTIYNSGYNFCMTGFAYNRNNISKSGWMVKTDAIVQVNSLYIPKTAICSTIIYSENNKIGAKPKRIIINGTALVCNATDGWANNSQINRLGSTFSGNIYAVRIYNRALTEDEISKNFELDKERFGLNI